MKTIFSLIFLLCTFCAYSQEDSLYISIFVSPTEELLIEEQDSIMLIEDAIHSEVVSEYIYEFYVAGFDTILTNSFTASFTSTDGSIVSQNFLWDDLVSNPNVNIFEDSVTLPLGTLEYIEIYEYEIEIYDENGNLLISLSDFYDVDED